MRVSMTGRSQRRPDCGPPSRGLSSAWLRSSTGSATTDMSVLLHGDAQVDEDEHARDEQHDRRERRAEADAAPLADAVLGDEGRDELEAVAALVDDPDEVEGTQRLDEGHDEDDDVDRPHHGEDDLEE